MFFLLAIVIILAALFIGEAVSVITKAAIPSVFVTAIIFLIGFWTVLPKDILDIAGFSPVIVNLTMYLLIVHMGTLMSFKDLVQQWKTVAIALGGIIGICILCLTFGWALFGRETALVATPPLAGGIVASLVMSDAAKTAGFDDLAVLAVLIYVIQGFAGYPLTAIALKREAKRLAIICQSGKANIIETKTIENESEKKKLLPQLPEAYESDVANLLKIAICGCLAYYFTVFLKSTVHIDIHPLVMCLIVGVLGRELGFLSPRVLDKAHSFGLCMTILLAFIFGSLKQATPAMLSTLIVPIFGIIILGVIGIAIASFFLSKLLGYSKEMAFAIGLTALFGFPANFVLTVEAIKHVAKNEQESAYLNQEMLPKMLVGGFTTVTVVSVIIAGVFAKML